MDLPPLFDPRVAKTWTNVSSDSGRLDEAAAIKRDLGEAIDEI